MKQDKLATPVQGLIVRCGGTAAGVSGRLMKRSCPWAVVVPFSALVSEVALSAWCTGVGAALAVAAVGTKDTPAGSSFVDEEGLHVNGPAALDILCARCGRELLAHLEGK